MSDVEIVIIDGIRYRKDDAKRRGLLEAEPKVKAEDVETPEPKVKAVSNKAANPASK